MEVVHILWYHKLIFFSWEQGKEEEWAAGG